MKVALVALCATALVFAASAAGSSRPLAPPSGLHAFAYRADDPVKADHTYALMPAFAWKPIVGARVYDLELATSRSFNDATVIYRNEYNAPVASLQKTVPWMTGHPYALWVRVRVHAGERTSGWSQPFGFNTAWQDIPRQLPSPEGLIRWTPIDGATSYDVWYLSAPGGVTLHFPTLTNVADEREFWSFHPQLAKGTIFWRVRANRVVTDPSLPNGIPEVTHGPFSPVYRTTVDGQTGSGQVAPIEALSDTSSTPAQVRAHQLTPGFAWTGNTDVLGDQSPNGLWRVYVFSDKQCVNPVLTGSVVGGDSWAPRDGDPLQLPGDTLTLADVMNGAFPGWGAQGKTIGADGEDLTSSESLDVGGGASSTSTGAAGSGASSSTVSADRLVQLGDNGWPQGRYWWTVVPVFIYKVPVKAGGSGGSSGSGSGAAPVGTPIEYHDMALPQDLCAAGQVWPFGMQSSPLTTTSQAPFASGLGSGSRVVSAGRSTPSFQELPVVTWKPALNAQTYEVQVSKKAYPWTVARSVKSVVTSAVLPLTRTDIGTWYYRVRGVNPNLVGPAQKLAWSKPVAIRIAGDHFTVVK
jgi:hypothetical protein